MDLNTYMKKEEMTNADLAKIIGVNESYISLLRRNQRRPSPELAESIERISLGNVTRMELLYPD